MPQAPPRAPKLPPRKALAPTVRHWHTVLDGSETLLVRPYLTAHERAERTRVQRPRRDVPWPAAYGVDLDDRDIHVCLGAAA
ncbi:hypothetical protein ACF061_14565 [Streptomyces sp. NPDC015220]|uniref:hypothetical protein n=1 Tax=Streptomyces sp. NPDC015220 TaxID=3364947 RepID=UPI0036FAC650